LITCVRARAKTTLQQAKPVVSRSPTSRPSIHLSAFPPPKAFFLSTTFTQPPPNCPNDRPNNCPLVGPAIPRGSSNNSSSSNGDDKGREDRPPENDKDKVETPTPTITTTTTTTTTTTITITTITITDDFHDRYGSDLK
jgi:hypothetical protein